MLAGILCGCVTVAALYAVTMLAYFRLRRKYAETKYAVEAGIALFAIAVSVITRMYILTELGDGTFESGFSAALFAIYSGIGGLAFEGIDSVSGVELNYINCIYSGVSLYAGLIALSVITATASYEIYSKAGLLGLKLRLKLGICTDVYVFKTATPDTLLLAESIKNRYSEKEFRSRRVRIVYCGELLEPFDRKNFLHKEIMSRGFLYWSYNDRPGGGKSVLRRLGLYIRNDAHGVRASKNKGGVYVFAFAQDQDLVGSESVNGKSVFKEISLILKENSKDCSGLHTVTDFYLLTGSELNYEYYERVTDDIVSSAAKKAGADAEKLKKYFQVHVINESVLAGMSLTGRRMEADGENGNGDFAPVGDGKHYAVVLGFGETGKQAMNSVYVNNACFDERGVPLSFEADVFDTVATSKAGLYKSTHPLTVCISKGDSLSPISREDDFAVNAELRRISEAYEPAIKSFSEKGVKGMDFGFVAREMKFPVIAFHNVDCTELEFASSMKYDGRLTFGGRLVDSLIIALGDDEKDIATANAFIDEIKTKGSALPRGTRKQYVYVHLHDDRNYARINWTEADNEAYPHIGIVLFGNRGYIFSYNRIVDEKQNMKYSYGYHLIADGGRKDCVAENEISGIFTKIKDNIKSGENTDFLPHLKKISGIVSTLEPHEYKEKWLYTKEYKKESNRAAERFGRRFRRELDTKKELTGAELMKLAELEHDRWNRFYIAHGWYYSFTGKRESDRVHNCLCPFAFLSEDTRAYDIVNVALAYNPKK